MPNGQQHHNQVPCVILPVYLLTFTAVLFYSVCYGHRSVYIYPDAVPPIHVVSYHVATDKPPAQNGDKFRSILATIYNQSQLA